MPSATPTTDHADTVSGTPSRPARVTRAALEQSEQRFRVLAEAAMEAIVIHDGDRVLDANPAFSEMFGFSREEVIGSHPSRYTTPGSMELIRDRVLSGDTRPYEVTGVRKDGTSFPILGRGMTIPLETRIVRVVALRDLSDVREAEQRLRDALQVERRAAQRLRELDQQRDAFLRAVAHDLRNPITVIMWLAQALSKDDIRLSSAEVREMLARIEANARRLDRLVLGLLDVDGPTSSA